METTRISHRERIEKVLSGDITDRVPFALWRHFPVDDQSAEPLVRATIAFQELYQFDLVKVTPASSFCLKDWGAEDRWNGNMEGTRDYTKRVIQTPEDWPRLASLDPTKGYLGAQIQVLESLIPALGSDTPVLQTIFSPLAQAKNLVGGEQLLVHMRKYPDSLHAGLKKITETTVNFLRTASQTGIAGIFYAVQHAQFELLSREEFLAFGKRYDLQILNELNHLWLNMVHLHGKQVMFAEVADYPVQIINWHDRDTAPALSEAATQFPGILCGGLSRWSSMVLGGPEEIDKEARDAIQQTGGRRLILGTGCVLPIIAPHGNILAAQHAAVSARP